MECAVRFERSSVRKVLRHALGIQKGGELAQARPLQTAHNWVPVPHVRIGMTALSVILMLFLAGCGSFCSLRFPSAQWSAPFDPADSGWVGRQPVGHWRMRTKGHSSIVPWWKSSE
jgi:predicted small lipoprotein YifL